jgi:hypothetical protein
MTRHELPEQRRVVWFNLFVIGMPAISRRRNERKPG